MDLLRKIKSKTISTAKVLYSRTMNTYNNGFNVGGQERMFDKKSTVTQLKYFFGEPTHIIDNIYIGSAINAASYDTLKENNIGMILNMTRGLPNFYEGCLNDNEVDDFNYGEFYYKKYDIEDDNQESIYDYFDKTLEDIKLYQKVVPEKNILIHCFMGASRSASIIINYLMKEKDMPFAIAIKHMLDKREIVNPTNKFRDDLLK